MVGSIVAGESIAVEVGLDVKIVAEIVIVPEDGASKSVKKWDFLKFFKRNFHVSDGTSVDGKLIEWSQNFLITLNFVCM